MVSTILLTHKKVSGRDVLLETSSSELGGRPRYQSEHAHNSLHLSRKRVARLVWGTCFQIVQVRRGWLRSVYDNVGVDGDERLWSSMARAM